MIDKYFITNDQQSINSIKKLQGFLVKYENYNLTNFDTPNLNESDFKSELLQFLAVDFTWIGVEYENINKLIQNNEKELSDNIKNIDQYDQLCCVSYDLFYFKKHILGSPSRLLKMAKMLQRLNKIPLASEVDKFSVVNHEILKYIDCN